MKMDSASLPFIAFGVAVAFLSNIHRSAAWRSSVLFVASIGFLYMLAHNVILLIPLASFLLLGYLAIVLIDRGWLRLFSVAVIAVILVYIWLKKYTFLPLSVLYAWAFLHLFPRPSSDHRDRGRQ
jgi:alginate O-acetyltransferase complex protein AlgI